MGWKPVAKSCPRCGTEFMGVPTRIHCSRACSARISRNKRHGLNGTPVNYVWREMRKRCRNPNNKDYPHYGARGIQVCERWDVFENFLQDMGPRPGPEYTIERVDNDGNYCPENCEWVTRDIQNKNRSNVYTPAQDQQIRDCAAGGLNFTQMSRVIGKSASSVSMRAYRLGLASGQPAKRRSSELASPNCGGK